MDNPLPAGAPGDTALDYADYPGFEIGAAGHNFAFYPCGASRLETLVALIGEAKTSVQAFYYLFDKDTAGTAVRDALVKAAQRGVAVHLIVDDFGNDAGADFFAPLVEAGGTFAIFSPRISRYYLVRNHQKFAIFDDARVMTGGANVSDHYVNPPAENGWCDLGVVIEGALVGKFAEWFDLLARWVDGEAQGRRGQLRRLRDLMKQWDGSARSDGEAGEGTARLLVSGPFVRRGHWAWMFRKDLACARRLDMVSAYFSPPRSVRRQFARAARRGKLRMVMAGKSDFAAALDKARLLYGKLLRARADIFEFQPCKLHMKLLVVDDVSYFGSANLDKRSFRVNVELMVRIEDAALAARLRELIDHLEAASQPITRDWYAEHAHLAARLRWRLAYWLSFADYRISRASTG